VQTATEAVPAIGKSPQLCDSAPQSGRSKYYSPNIEFALSHRHCEHTKERQEERRKRRGKEERRKRSVEEEDGRRRGGWQHGKKGMHARSVIAPTCNRSGEAVEEKFQLLPLG
jgi:hypothetical protein